MAVHAHVANHERKEQCQGQQRKPTKPVDAPADDAVRNGRMDNEQHGVLVRKGANQFVEGNVANLKCCFPVFQALFKKTIVVAPVRSGFPTQASQENNQQQREQKKIFVDFLVVGIDIVKAKTQ